MRRLVLAALTLLALALGGGLARADDFSDEQLMLLKLFGPDPLTTEMFSPGFLAQVSMPQILEVFSRERQTVGAPVSIEPKGRGYIVHTRSYDVPVDLGLDGNGRVAVLLLHPAIPVFASVDDVLAAIASVGAKVSYLITRNGQVLYAHGQTLPLAVSSGFKLGVLAALKDEIDAGQVRWDQVVRLSAAERSLTPGVLQTMPPGAPVTVHTLAAFMISQSDGTATDALIDLVGRDKVAAKLGGAFVLKTSEFFKLKADPALRLRFVGADDVGRLAAAGEMAAMPLPDVDAVGAPLDDGVEWYLSSSQLCGLAAQVAGLDVFTINDGVASPADWPGIAFKGGSEVGVASLTTELTARDGSRYCVSTTANDHRALDEDRFTSLYGALIGRLAASR